MLSEKNNGKSYYHSLWKEMSSTYTINRFHSVTSVNYLLTEQLTDSK